MKITVQPISRVQRLVSEALYFFRDFLSCFFSSCFVSLCSHIRSCIVLFLPTLSISALSINHVFTLDAAGCQPCQKLHARCVLDNSNRHHTKTPETAGGISFSSSNIFYQSSRQQQSISISIDRGEIVYHQEGSTIDQREAARPAEIAVSVPRIRPARQSLRRDWRRSRPGLDIGRSTGRSRWKR